MSGLLQKLRAQAGFTMIELLVVIAVIGVLSVAVLSSINPIEQINKGRDTRSRSDAAQLISAVDRYFAIHEAYPWNEANATPTAGGFGSSWGANGTYAAASSPYVTPPTGSTNGNLDYRSQFEFNEADGTSVTADYNWSWLIPIVNTAEVKESFATRMAKVTDNTNFYVYKPEGANKTMYTCFEPSSFSFDLEASKRCDPNDANHDSQLVLDVPAACGDHGGSAAECWEDTNDDDKCWVCLP